MRAVADEQAAVYFDSGIAQLADFFQERHRIKHDAVADHALASCAQHAAGNQLQNKFLSIDNDGMPGIVPACIAHHHLEIFREHIDNLAFALIAPLGADDDRCIASVQNSLRKTSLKPATTEFHTLTST